MNLKQIQYTADNIITVLGLHYFIIHSVERESTNSSNVALNFPTLFFCSANKFNFPTFDQLYKQLLVAIRASARISTWGKLPNLQLITLGKTPSKVMLSYLIYESIQHTYSTYSLQICVCHICMCTHICVYVYIQLQVCKLKTLYWMQLTRKEF